MRSNIGLISLSLFASAMITQLQPAAVAQETYPSNFLWGTAMAAHQVEGLTGGGENADWYPFEHTPGHIYNNDTADIATDHWNRYEEDFQLAAALGVNTIRTSVAWEKIEPLEGQFSEEAIQHYRTEFTSMRKFGLRPMITLLHGTTPLWFQSHGGWLAPDSPQQFAAYVKFVVSRLGDLCDLWATLNEPMVLIGEGYFEGIIPPQIASPESAILAAWNMICAHRLATSSIHELQPLSAPNSPGTPLRGVGLVNSLDLYYPYNRLNPLDDLVTSIYVELSNWAFPKAAVYGHFTIDKILGQLLRKQLSHPPGSLDNPGAKGSPVVDWIGVNYYTVWLVQFNPKGQPNLVVPPSLAAQKTDIGRAIYPQGTERILRDTASQFPGIPLVMTENGVADAADRFRPQFIRDTLHYLDLAKFGHDGLPAIDVRGYYHWSLTDDFEWQRGYFSRYGLFEILHDQNLERVPRPSGTVYCQGISARLPPHSTTANCDILPQVKGVP
jgi:beta-glucosidase